MSVTLTNAPTPFSFSGDHNLIRFTSDNYLENGGSAAIGEITFSGPIAVGTEIALSWGSQYVAMVAAALPDQSGTQFFNGDGSAGYVAAILTNFKANYLLSRDFNILADGNKLRFIAKKMGYGFDLSSTSGSGYAVAPTSTGVPEKPRKKFSIYFELFLENAAHTEFDKIYTANLPLIPGEGGASEVNISSLLHNELLRAAYAGDFDLPSLSTTTPMECKNTCRQYYFRYAESYDGTTTVMKTAGNYSVILGKLSYVGAAEKTISEVLSYFGNDRFLRQGPNEHKVLSNQPQFLFFFNTKATAPGTKLRVSWYFTNNTSVIQTIAVFDMEQYRKYGFNVRFDVLFNPDTHPGKDVLSYEVWLEDSAGTRLSEYRNFALDYEVKLFVRNFLYLSSWGSIDTLLCYGKAYTSYEHSQKEVAKIRRPGYVVSDGDFSVFDLKLQDKFEAASGWISKDQLILNRDFILSPQKFRYATGRLLPITLTSKEIKEMEDAENKFSQVFEYKYLFEDDAFTERNEDEAEVITEKPKILPVYFGASASKPTTAAAVKALSSQLETIYEFTFNSGTEYRYFNVGMPDWKSLSSATDAGTGENLTHLFKPSNIVIDGQNYPIYTMEMAVPYLTSHSILIVLKNG